MGNLVVKFDVGGTVYRTYESTLSKSKYFSTLVNKKKRTENQSRSWFAGCSGDSPKKISGDEEMFIDRDGFLFRYILLYLRTSELHIEKQHLRSLRTKAEFYQVPDLLSMINTMIREEQLK